MEKQIEESVNQNKNQELPQIKSGDTVRVYQKYKDKEKEKIQVFEGMVICRKHGNEIGASITVRKIASGVGVEKIFPLHSPIIDKIEVVRSGKTRRAKLYYIRDAKGRKSKLKQTRVRPLAKPAAPKSAKIVPAKEENEEAAK
jgi:large subunit ribosomal protein L19